jgi:uncharacterized protein
MTDSKKGPEVACPTCDKKQVWDTSNKDRPFCSPRCKLIDLGEWASEGHKIAGPSLEEEMMSRQIDDLY